MNQKPESIAHRIARELLGIGALRFAKDKPFTWASGILSPMYCDNRLTISYPKIRRILTDGFVEKSSEYEFDCVAGVATAGIPHAAWLADRLSLPLVYVRPEAKGHGRQNQIEGYLPENSTVLMVEDLVATGLSSIQAAEAVQEATGTMPVCTLAIFSYCLQGVSDLFQNKGTPLHTLSDLDTLLSVAVQTGYINAKKHDSLLDWRSGYDAWTVSKWEEERGE